MFRQSAIAVVLLCGACTGGSSLSSSGFSDPFPEDEASVPPSPPEGIGLFIENTSEAPLDVGSLLLPSAAIDERLLTRKVNLDLPSSVITEALFHRTIAPHGVETLLGAVMVVPEGLGIPAGGLEATPAAVIEVGGEMALYVGAGKLLTRRVDGVIKLVPQDSTRVRSVRIAKDVPLCTGAKPPLAYQEMKSGEPNAPFKITETTRDANGCTKVKLDRVTPPAEQREIRFCAEAEAWPFALNDEVLVSESPSIARGLRLERADKVAFEVAIADFPGSLPFNLRTVQINEDTSCILPIDPSRDCKEVLLRGTATPDRVDLTYGPAWVSGGMKPLFASGCPGMMPLQRIEVVSRWTP